MSITEFVIRRPKLGVLLTLIAVVGGVMSMLNLQREVFPEAKLDMVAVTTLYPNASPEEVEDLITNEIEEEISDIEDIESYTSNSREGISAVVIVIDSDAEDKDKVVDEIQREVDRVKLPDSAEDPVIMEFSTDQPIIRVCLSSEEGEASMRQFAREMETKLERIPGAGTIERNGWRDEEFLVEVDLDKLEDYELSLGDIETALRRRNVNLPGGKITRESGDEIVLRTVGKFYDEQEISSVVIRSNLDGRKLSVSNVATVARGYQDTTYRARANGKPAIVLGVKKKPNADVIEVVDAVRKLVDAERELRPETYTIALVDDASYYVKRRLNVVANNGLVGMALVLVMLLLFLDTRMALFTAFGIPFSFLATFIAMIFFGFSVNLMTMFGMIIVLGMIVDDAIIVGENVSRYIEAGMPRRDAAIKGTKEVTLPVLSTVLTTIAAFAPMYLAPGIYSSFLGALAGIVILTLCASLFECLFLLPSHASEFTPSGPHKKSPLLYVGDGIMWVLRGVYSLLITASLKLRYLFLAGVGAGFYFVTLFVMNHAKIDIFPKDLIDIFSISISSPVNASRKQTEDLTREVEKVIETIPRSERMDYTAYLGIRSLMDATSSAQGARYANVIVYLTPQETRERTTEEILAEFSSRCREKLSNQVELSFDLISPGPPAAPALEARIVGQRYVELNRIADDLMDWLAKKDGLEDIQSSFSRGKDELHVVVDEPKAARLGLTVDTVARTVFSAFEGSEVTVVREGGEELPVRVRLQERFRNRQSTLQRLSAPSNLRRQIPLTAVARIESRPGLPSIAHYNGDRMVTVTARTVKGKDDFGGN